jgi:hypothetical protein
LWDPIQFMFKTQGNQKQVEASSSSVVSTWIVEIKLSLPCGGCQRFESAYLQLVSLVGTKLYDSTQFFRFGSLIYDLSFIDVDKILPFSITLGWHSLKVKGEVQTRKGLRWIPRHPETRKGIVSDEMLRGVERPKPKHIGSDPTQ